MTNKRKLITILIVLAIALGLIFYFYASKKKTIFEGAKVTIPIHEDTSPSPEQNQTPDGSSDNSSTDTQTNTASENTPDPLFPSETKNNTSDSTPIDINNRGVTDGKMLAHITAENCDSNCKAYGNDLRLLEYCQQACGISPVKDVSSCDNKKDLEKDYCEKDLAINKKDASLCDKISDVNIKATCKNRIIEDSLEK